MPEAKGAEVSTEAVFLALALLHLVAKGLTHQVKGRDWARRPLIEGLPISDWYHIYSGAMWPVFGWMAWRVWGADWHWYVVGLVLGGLLWPLTKWEKAPAIGWGGIIREAWWWQLASLAYTRIRR